MLEDVAHLARVNKGDCVSVSEHIFDENSSNGVDHSLERRLDVSVPVVVTLKVVMAQGAMQKAAVMTKELEQRVAYVVEKKRRILNF